jgi:hypothetical protein
MKFGKIAGFIALTVIAALAVILGHAWFRSSYITPDLSDAMAAEFGEYCLDPTVEPRPVWECYEISVSAAEHEPVTIRHADGEEHRVITFQQGDQTMFRFTPTKPGVWTFSTGGEIAINGDRPAYAKGFLAAEGKDWVRTATGEAVIPQYVMYDKPDLDSGLDIFMDGHGFSGFHITNLRDFMDNPGYFEAVILKTYRRGGISHFWIWGDRSRNQTPDTYGVDVERLYAEIAARLAPLPGWSMSYGFDLFEWASAEEIETLRNTMHGYSSYHHLIGGRGHKNEYREISSNLDYASWEWHQPDYEDYREHLERANGRPAFSEDRFRIRTPTRYPEKDYDPELTRKGLWNSAIAGGVANIWGHKPEGMEFSEPYPNQDTIKTYSVFIDKVFTTGMEPANQLIDRGHCLRNGQGQAICYSEEVSQVALNLGELDTAPQDIFAVDTRKGYEEIPLDVTGEQVDWEAPYESDWAFAILN